MKILYDPDPRTTDDIFSEPDHERFFSENLAVLEEIEVNFLVQKLLGDISRN